MVFLFQFNWEKRELWLSIILFILNVLICNLWLYNNIFDCGSWSGGGECAGTRVQCTSLDQTEQHSHSRTTLYTWPVRSNHQLAQITAHYFTTSNCLKQETGIFSLQPPPQLFTGRQRTRYHTTSTPHHSYLNIMYL